jgi:hypothetical protein
VLCAAFTWFASMHRARAAETPPSPERVRLMYALGADCPTPAVLEHELDARLGPDWRARPDELARTLSISEQGERGGHRVRIEYTDGSEHRVARELNASTCEEASQMTAVIVAVAIDALARERERETWKSPAVRSERALAAPLTRVPAATTLSPEHVSEPHPVAFVHEVGLRVSVTSGFGTRAAWGAGVEGGLVGRRGFALRAAFEARATGSVPAADAQARFSAFTLRGEACVVALRLSALFSVPLCAGLEAGVLRAEGVVSAPAVTAAEPSVVPWIAGLLTPRMRLATARAYVELVPELRLPFAGHTFTFESPLRSAFTIPGVAAGVGLAAGMRFH